MIDLRSDTVTRPTPAMREAMARAPVGDDQYGEDPTTNALQEKVAALLGKEAALWLPSGTMANQVALRTLTHPGDDVVVSTECHAVWHETGGSAANSGVQFTVVGKGGLFTAAEFEAAAHPRNHILYPPTTLVEIENTQNRSGGIVFPQAEAVRICESARKRGIATFLDGARLWNAAVAQGATPAKLAEPFDLVSVALSKGLGAPAGSLLAGPRATIDRCMRYRRMFGGAMRQTGIYAAAGIHGIDHHYDRLSEDHANARLIAERLVKCKRVKLDMATVQTNILVFHLAADGPDGATVAARAKQQGVLLFPFGPRIMRLVTHLDVTRDQCLEAAEVLETCIES